MAEYREILTRYPERRAALMPVLWLAQREFGWLSPSAQRYVAAEVASFGARRMVGTSGTFLDLARMAAAARTGTVPAAVNQLVVGDSRRSRWRSRCGRCR